MPEQLKLEAYLEQQGFLIERPFQKIFLQGDEDRTMAFQAPMHHDYKSVESLLEKFYREILNYAQPSDELNFVRRDGSTLSIKLDGDSKSPNIMKLYILKEKLIE